MDLVKRNPELSSEDPEGLVIEVVAKFARARGMAQLAQGFGFDLPNPLASDAKLTPDFLQGPLATVFEAETELQDAPLAAGERIEHVVHLLLQHLARRDIRRRQRGLVGHEIAQVTVILGAHRNLQGDRLERSLANLAHAVRGQLELRGQLLVSWFTADVLFEPT